jgi:nicotinamide riboside kinase
MALRIAIVGPESSGKSTLAEQLSVYFNAKHILEFARNYLSQLKRPYSFEDIEYINTQQLLLEKELEHESLLFCEAAPINQYIWCLEKYKKESALIKTSLLETKYDLYLLCKPDLAWEYDPLRENENDRDRLFDLYQTYLKKYHFKYCIVEGLGSSRFELSKQYIKKYFFN